MILELTWMIWVPKNNMDESLVLNIWYPWHVEMIQMLEPCAFFCRFLQVQSWGTGIPSFPIFPEHSLVLYPPSSTFNGQLRSQRQMRDLAIDLHSLHNGSVHAGPQDRHGCLLITNLLISIDTPTKCKKTVFISTHGSPKTSILKLKKLNGHEWS